MKRALRAATALYFLAMAVAVTYPGVVPFNHARPFVLGLPFSFAWPVAWVVGAGIVWYLLYRVEER